VSNLKLLRRRFVGKKRVSVFANSRVTYDNPYEPTWSRSSAPSERHNNEYKTFFRFCSTYRVAVKGFAKFQIESYIGISCAEMEQQHKLYFTDNASILAPVEA
jgi:hypothetical protein